MNLHIQLFNSATKHIKGQECKLIEKKLNLSVVKEERFAFQIMIKSDEKFLCQLNKTNDIHYLGLNEKIRIELDVDKQVGENFDMSFIGYIKDDEENLIGDQILNNKSMYIEDYQMIWVEGKMPKNYSKDNYKLNLKFYHTTGYKKETLIEENSVDVKVCNYTLKPVDESDFFLDLWQHPCNWARQYNVDYYSDEHFIIIENFIKEMAKLGQKVIDLIVTDYPWAGQRCYEVFENPSNLFEMNMVEVYKKNNKIECDFSSLDRYLDICFKYNINKEINLFGLIGNWDAFKFGSPLNDYRDAMRINYYNEDEELFDYIKSKEDFKEYLSLLFKHLDNKKLLDITKIICDEPDNLEIFNENVEFIQSSIPGRELKYKCAIHHQEFFEKCDLSIENLSLNTCELINNIDKLDDIKNELEEKSGYFTWYSCCFPDKLNIFLSSPTIESRLVGWFTYYFNLDGFLRWAYGVWPGDVFNNSSYKKEKWKAGDMFFVYPGENMKPMDSVRVRNFLFGIQDFMILKDAQSKMSREEIINSLEDLLGKKEDMKFLGEREIFMNYSLDYDNYANILENIVSKM